eukprot:c26000_g1_i1 orf=578-2509(+)
MEGESKLSSELQSLTVSGNGPAETSGVQWAKFSKRVLISTILGRPDGGLGLVGERVVVGGWVKTGREQGKGSFAFLEVNDGSCTKNLQVLVNATIAPLNQLTPTGTCVLIEGELKQPPQGVKQKVELCVEKLLEVGLCDASRYPMAKARFSLDHLRTYMHLRVRTNTISAVARIRNAVAYATHSFFQQHGFLYVHTPIITTSDCEGAGEMFQVTTLLNEAEKRDKEAKINPLPTETEIAEAKETIALKKNVVKKLKEEKEAAIGVALQEVNKDTSDCNGSREKKLEGTGLLSEADKREGKASANSSLTEAEDAARNETISVEGDSVKMSKEEKQAAIYAALQELNRAKENLAKLEERAKLKPGIRQKDGSVDYSADFFGRQAFLTVSGQLQAETYACALSSVYTFGPTFRAENSHTHRHLAEFWMVEPEIAFADLEDAMNCAESYVKFICTWLLDSCLDEMEFLAKMYDKSAIARLQLVATSPFVRISYTEAIQVLQQVNDRKFENEVEWGIDLASEHERYLTEEVYNKPVIVYNYPKDIKAFYMRANDDGMTVAAMDVLVPKVGELVGGSQREERYEVLERRLMEMKLPREPYEWYLDLRKFGTVKHAGFGLGFERMLLFATGIENIRDVIPFPRYPGKAEL